MSGAEARTKACAEWRERLGEWLAGALEAEAAEAVERHVEACAACAAELGAMARLEEDLRDMGRVHRLTPAPWQETPAGATRTFRLRTWVGLAAAAAVVVAFAHYVFLLTLERKPWREDTLYVGAVVEPADRVTVMRLADRRALHTFGSARFHVQPRSGGGLRGVEPFQVDTPLGRFTALGTEFTINVAFEEESVGSKAGTGALVAVVAVVSGTVGYLSNDGKVSATVDAGQRGVAREGKFEVAAAEPPPELVAARKKLDEAEGEKRALAAAVEKKEAERAALAGKLADAEKKLAAASAPAAKAAPAPAKTGPAPLPITFGPHAKVPEVAQANWAEMGEAAKNINGLLGDLLERMRAGEKPAPELQIGIARENMKLQKFAFAAVGKLPTHGATGNGEFTHPIAMANLIAEHLDAAALPLSEPQIADIGTFGEEYDFEWERLQSSYTTESLRLEKILDELEAKQRFFMKTLAALSPEQRAVIAPPGVHGHFMLDLHSPLLMLVGFARPFGVQSHADLRTQVVAALVKSYALPSEKVGLVEPLVDRYLVEIGPVLKPIESKDDVAFFTYDEAVPLGRAALRLVKQLPQALDLDDAARQKLIDEPGFGIPRLLPQQR